MFPIEGVQNGKYKTLRDLGLKIHDQGLKKLETLTRKITQKQDFETYHKCFQDFEIRPKFSKNHVLKKRSIPITDSSNSSTKLLGGSRRELFPL